MRWMRRRGDRVRVTTGKYASRSGTVENDGFQVMMDTGEVVIVRWDRVEGLTLT